MKYPQLFIIVLSLLSAFPVWSFDWEKCSRGLPGGKGVVVGIPMFTTSFISSTGGCAMIGERTHDRKAFMAYNLDKVQVDAARGGGEYLSVMASLYSCESGDVEKFSRLMQKNYKEIFSSGHSTQNTLSEMDEIVTASRRKIGACRV